MRPFAGIEVLSALRGLERGRRLSSRQAGRALRDLDRMRLVLSSCGPLRDRIGSCGTT